MNTALRRLRGILVSAVLWAFIWSVVGGLGGIIHYFTGDRVRILDVLPHPPMFWLQYSTTTAFSWGLIGAISGGVYAGVLAFAERRRAVGDLNLGRVALWGVLGALIVPVAVFAAIVFMVPLADLSVELLPLVAMAALGASCAVGTLLLARRAPAAASDHGNVAA